jgi:hypothetical protein
MNKEDVKKIIEAGNLAPSGSNSQPWEFKVKDNVIEVIARPEKDHPILNFKNRGTYIAHGALIENIDIASKYFGYEPEIEIFPYKEDKNVTARIILNRNLSSLSESDLFDAIARRCSNRKLFKREKVNNEVKNYLLKDLNLFDKDVEVLIIEDDKISEAAKFLANEIVVFFQNKKLHKFMYNEILWNEDDQKIKPGLYIKTLEIPPQAIKIFKALGNWYVAKLLSKISFLKKLKEANVYKNSSCSLMIGVVVKTEEAINYINAGRVIEKIWLRATKQNLSVQFMAGLFFLWQQLNFGKKEIFNNPNIEIINESYKNLSEIFGAKNGYLIGVLRIGISDPSSAVSYKRSPQMTFIN